MFIRKYCDSIKVLFDDKLFQQFCFTSRASKLYFIHSLYYVLIHNININTLIFMLRINVLIQNININININAYINIKKKRFFSLFFLLDYYRVIVHIMYYITRNMCHI